MDKTRIQYLLSCLLLIVCTNQMQAQSTKKLEKLYKKHSYDKLVQLSSKRIQRNKMDTLANYYYLIGLLQKGQQTKGLAAEQYYRAATEHWLQVNFLFTSGTTLHELLKKQYHTAGIRISGFAVGKDDTTARYYVQFLAENFQDTTALYAKFFPPAANTTAVSEITFTNSENKISVKKDGIQFSVPLHEPSRQDLIKKSEEVMGTPWKMGAIEPHKAFDCSGFVVWCFNQFGYELPHNTKMLAKISKPILLTEAQPGDLVCFGSTEYAPGKVYHIAMIHSRDGNEVKIIHCGTTNGVSVVDLTSGYWSGMSYFVVRLIDTVN